ncbi:MAG: cytidylate kinase-like family protein [bacterium]
MSTASDMEKCLAYISAHTQPSIAGTKPAVQRPSVTISRQSGTGAMVVADRLAEFLETHAPAPGKWTVFNRNIVEQALTDHNLPLDLAKYMPENRVSAIDDMLEELFGLHPASMTLVRETAETLLHLAALGNVILVGRASAAITRALGNVFHVRIIAPLGQRVERTMKQCKLTRKAALDFVCEEERGRKLYMEDNFKADIDDPLLYDIVLNMARIQPDEAARIIGEAVLRRAKK